jgi:crossover junction endodeoxyribonuclease RuvC
MLILGVDPGSRKTGYGVIESHQGKLSYVGSGCIRMDLSGDFTDRLKQIFVCLTEIVTEYRPDAGAIEDVFLKNNPNSAIKLGRAQGAAIAAMMQFDMPVQCYSAREVKKSVVSYGAASKEQVQYMVRILLNLSGTPQADAADALAIAICHANSRRSIIMPV